MRASRSRGWRRVFRASPASIGHRASRPVAGARAAWCAARASLGMHFQLVQLSRGGRPTQHACGHPPHRTRFTASAPRSGRPRPEARSMRVAAWAGILDFAEIRLFQAFFDRIVRAPWSDRDSVAERKVSAALDADRPKYSEGIARRKTIASSRANFAEPPRRARQMSATRSQVVPCGPSLMRTPIPASWSRTRSL